MDHSPINDPDYFESGDQANSPCGVPSFVGRPEVLEKLAAALELTAARLAMAEEGDRFVWRKEKSQ
jgi:hypothetical protein